MCLAIPGKIKSIESRFDGLVRMAKVSFGGIIKEASLEMVPQAKVDDYVLVHVGFAISVIDAKEAEKVFRYIEQIESEQGDVDSTGSVNQDGVSRSSFNRQ